MRAGPPSTACPTSYGSRARRVNRQPDKGAAHCSRTFEIVSALSALRDTALAPYPSAPQSETPVPIASMPRLTDNWLPQARNFHPGGQLLRFGVELRTVWLIDP